jgi:hypothetical protein
MKTSQRALLTALGVVVVIMLASVIWVRLHISPAIALSGQRVTLTPALTDFDSLEISGSWQLTLQQGDAWRVELDVPTELKDRLDVRVDGDRLRLGLDEGAWFGGFDEHELTAKITMPQLRALHISGAGDVDFSGFTGERLEIVLSGAGQLEGHASRFDALELAMSGAGEADFRDVTATDALVSLSGAGKLTLTMAGGKLTGHMSGAGDLTYYGTVSEESVTTSGAADVHHAD